MPLRNFSWEIVSDHAAFSNPGLFANHPVTLPLVYENIIPTLDVTESTTQGYVKHILPLAFNNPMVRSAFLAASASHIQIAQGARTMVDRLSYRSTAIAELRHVSARPETDSCAPLATILGLMIDDMICGHRECPALLKLAEFWVHKNGPFSTDPNEKATRRFLLDQVQLYAWNHPLTRIKFVTNMSFSQW